jgi:replicative DNA helicase
MQDVAMAALMAFDDRVERAGKLLGYSCGVSDLDGLTAGWQPTQLITIAGRPGSGKSVLLAQSSLRAALAGLHVMHFTLEMSAKETMIRLAKNHSLVGYSTGREHTLSAENKTKLRNALGTLSDLPLSIRTTDSIGQIVAECEVERRRGKCDMVVLDYLQIAQIDGDTKGDAGTRDAELSKATRLLKRMAMRLEVPVLIGSQLNRQAEGVRPTLASLRESGGIEADSNVVIGLWQEDPNMQPNIVTASIIKNRDNGIGDVRLYFNKPAHRMADTEKVKVEL